MIRLFNSKIKTCVSYKIFEEVCDHFRRIEHLKAPSEEALYEDGRWDFSYWSHKRLSVLNEHLEDTQFSQAEREAYERGLDLIEIFDGCSGLSDQYVVTPDLDITGLMREWCFGYACAHGYTILEIHPTPSPNAPVSEDFPTTGCIGLGSLPGGFREGNSFMTFP
jgi:hypothetical protein